MKRLKYAFIWSQNTFIWSQSRQRLKSKKFFDKSYSVSRVFNIFDQLLEQAVRAHIYIVFFVILIVHDAEEVDGY